MEKILIVTRNFPPLVGGMERLVFNIYKQASREFQCDVVGPAGCSTAVAGENRAFGYKIAPVPVFVLMALLKSMRLAFANNYSVCIAGSGVTGLIAVLISKLRNTRSMVLVHGLDLIASSRIYQAIFVPMIRHADVVIANSNNTARLAQEAGVDPARIRILHPGVDMPDEVSQPEKSFRETWSIDRKPILLSAGRLIPRKGLVEFIRYVLPAVVRKHRDTVLVIVGSEPENALNRTDSILNGIKSAIEENDLAGHVLMTGRVDENSLLAAYEEADCFVFPLREVPGDVEGFGMVAVEAAAHGLPTVAFAEGGVSDAISDGESGFLVTPGDYEGFSEILIKYLDNPDTMPSPASCRAFADRFNWNRFGDRLRHIINSTSAEASRQTE